jgi:hypothetical protein
MFEICSFPSKYDIVYSKMLEINMDHTHSCKKTFFGNSKGQNIIEYILVTAAVIAVLIAFTRTSSDGPVRNALDNVLNATVDDISRMKGELKFK